MKKKKKINIQNGIWLPKSTPHLVQSLDRGLSEDVIVVDITNKDIRWWNTILIKEVFVEVEAKEICQILISAFNNRDQHI